MRVDEQERLLRFAITGMANAVANMERLPLQEEGNDDISAARQAFREGEEHLRRYAASAGLEVKEAMQT